MKEKAVMVGVMMGLLVFLTAAHAQEAEPESFPRPHTRENLIAFKLLRMTQILELTEDQTARIYPALTKLEREKFEMTGRLNNALRSLRRLLEEGKAEESKIRAAVEDIGALRLAIRDKDLEADAFLKEQLSLKQYAKYTLFLVDFYRGLGERLERARGMMRKAPPAANKK